VSNVLDALVEEKKRLLDAVHGPNLLISYFTTSAEENGVLGEFCRPKTNMMLPSFDLANSGSIVLGAMVEKNNALLDTVRSTDPLLSKFTT